MMLRYPAKVSNSCSEDSSFRKSGNYGNFMWFPKALQFFSAAAGVPWGRFAVSYLKSKGLSPSQIANLRSAGLITKLFTYPLWGTMADACGDVKKVYIMCVIVGALFLEPFRRGWAFYSFGTILFFKVLRSGSNSIWPLTDAITVQVVKSDGGNGEGYGKQRVWCSLSWGVISFISGILIDKFGLQLIFIMTYFWAFMLVMTVLKGLPSFPREKKEEGGLLGRFIMLRRFMQQPKMRSFFSCVFVYSILWYMVEIIPIMQLEEFRSRGYSTRSLIGTAILFSTLPEFPVFYYEKYFTEKFTPRKLFAIAHWCTILRFFGYILVTVADSPWLILPFQLLHGGTFGLFWLTTMKYTHSVCPPDLRGSVQGCLSTVATIAQAISSMFWGEVYEHWGPNFTYSLGIVLLMGSLVLINSVLSDAVQPAPLYKVLSQQNSPRSKILWTTSQPESPISS